MRTLLVVLIVAVAGCSGIADAIVDATLGEALDAFAEGIQAAVGAGPIIYALPDDAVSSTSSLAFLTGADSENVLCFVVDAGSWDPVASYQDGEKPIGIATDAAYGLVTTTTLGVRRQQELILSLEDLEIETGAVEVGRVAAAGDEVIVAATTEAGATFLVRVDVASGAVLGTTEPRAGTDILGLAVAGDMAVVAEAPGGDIVCYDLTQPAPERVVLASGGEGQPAGITVGHTGNLFVASRDEPVVRELDLVTGEELGRFAIAAPGLVDIVFDPASEHYLAIAGADAIYEVDSNGALLDVHVHEELAGANAITILGR